MKDCNKYIIFCQAMKRLFRNKTGIGVSEWQLKTLAGGMKKNIENAARTKVFVLASYTAGEAARLSAYGIKNL